MDLIEAIEKRNINVTEIENVINSGKNENRELTEEETNNIQIKENEIKQLDAIIEEKNNDKKNNRNKVENFSELITSKRNADGTIQNFSVRAVTLSAPIQNTFADGTLSHVGYEPFYKQMGCTVMSNLTGNIDLPYVSTLIAGKKGEGESYTSDGTLGKITLTPKAYTITETVGRELMAVANEKALQGYIFEMVKSLDRAITKDIKDVIGAAAITGYTLTGYTTANIDTLEAAVDGNITFLMPRAEFYKAKGVKIDTNTGVFLANKTDEFSGKFWDGTPLFYSNLFSGSEIIVADLKHVTIGEWGSEYEISFNPWKYDDTRQVQITVSKLANVVLRNLNAAKKATIV